MGKPGILVVTAMEWGVSMEVVVRRLGPDDVDQVIDVFIRAYGEEPWNEKWNREDARERVSDLTENPSSICYVAVKEDGLVIGALLGRRTVFMERREVFIDEFFIAPQHQRNGYGRRLMDVAGGDLASKGYSYLLLDTVRGYPSEAFYLMNGFKPSEKTVYMYKDLYKAP